MPTKAPKEKNPAVQKIADMLAEAFNKVEAKIKGDLIASYRAYADREHKAFVAAASDPRNTGRISSGFGGRTGDRFSRWHESTKLDSKAVERARKQLPYQSLSTWEDVRPWMSFMKVDYYRADRDAANAFDNARDSFIHKNVDKIRNVFGARQEIKQAVVYFEFKGHRVFEGNLQVYFPNGDYFRAEVGLKYVVRYIPRTTPYFQYPLVFTEAEIAGKHHLRPSEEELRLLLGATKSRAAEKAEMEASAGFCPMSGQPVPAALWRPVASRMSPYVKCPKCGAVVSASRGIFRKHKTPAAERAGAVRKLETAGYCPMSREKVPQAIIDKMGPVEPYKDPKALCETCGQMVRLDAEKDWIPDPGGGYPTRMKVKSARYYKHKLPSAGGGA
jgi:hypothetical protein